MENLQNIRPGAEEICKILQGAGFQAFIVGGCVRDLILGQTPKDWDITTNALPEQVMELFPKNYPTGLQHGTITVAMGNGVENHFEITTYRIESEYDDGRRPNSVSFVNDIKEDLSRRDLTINAMAYDPISKELCDPFNGAEDLKNKLIRAVGNANKRFQEDGLRIMRAARFAARFGYNIDPDTLIGMKISIETLKQVSKERISDELSKTLMTSNPRLGLQLLFECGALQVACPFLTSHPSYTHFFNSIEKYGGELETRLAFLYSNVSCEETKKELTNLKYSNKEIKAVLFLLDLEDSYGAFHEKNEANREVGYIEFMAKLKNGMPSNWEHVYSEFIILMGQVGYDVAMDFSPYISNIVLARKEMNINGDDLISIGVKPGPEIKRILEECYLEILFNPDNNDKTKLIDFINEKSSLVT